MRWLLLAPIMAATVAHAQPRVLHFTRTSGFDHNTRGVSFAMFQAIAGQQGLIVDDDATGAAFSDAALLATYDVIAFSNTSGDAILDAVQRANFEAWVASGGHVLGIHAATDTYRHSTANGGSTGTWDYYAELMGASVQENPNHVSGTPIYALAQLEQHPSTANLPDPWMKEEEYYYWVGGYFNPGNHGVLQVEETVGPNGSVNSYDAPRPMSWYRQLGNGSKVFCTALGHATSNYTEDALFRQHISDALAWLIDPTTDIAVTAADRPTVFPNPVQSGHCVTVAPQLTSAEISLTDAQGRILRTWSTDIVHERYCTNGLAPGHYFLRMGTSSVQLMLTQ